MFDKRVESSRPRYTYHIVVVTASLSTAAVGRADGAGLVRAVGARHGGAGKEESEDSGGELHGCWSLERVDFEDVGVNGVESVRMWMGKNGGKSTDLYTSARLLPSPPEMESCKQRLDFAAVVVTDLPIAESPTRP